MDSIYCPHHGQCECWKNELSSTEKEIQQDKIARKFLNDRGTPFGRNRKIKRLLKMEPKYGTLSGR